jgi:hypothetical protein
MWHCPYCGSRKEVHLPPPNGREGVLLMYGLQPKGRGGLGSPGPRGPPATRGPPSAQGQLANWGSGEPGPAWANCGLGRARPWGRAGPCLARAGRRPAGPALLGPRGQRGPRGQGPPPPHNEGVRRGRGTPPQLTVGGGQ